MNIINPINSTQQDQVLLATQDYIAYASTLFHMDFALIPVHFNLKGRAAGMYCIKNGEAEIRYNPYIFAKYFTENLTDTVPHEVAHYIADRLYGIRRIHPHGQEWQAIMHAFGADSRASCRYDLSGIPQRKEHRHSYQCRCRIYELSARRHNAIRGGKMQYRCQHCGCHLVIASYA